jgi:NAD+ kinase
MKLTKIAFVADETEIAQSALNSLKDKYPNVPETEANIVVALGGDGFMLETLHTFIGEKIPVFGMNCGTIGFLLNSFSLDNLLERIKNAETIELHPLEKR